MRAGEIFTLGAGESETHSSIKSLTFVWILIKENSRKVCRGFL
jgi:hypothetical protein